MTGSGRCGVGRQGTQERVGLCGMGSGAARCGGHSMRHPGGAQRSGVCHVGFWQYLPTQRASVFTQVGDQVCRFGAVSRPSTSVSSSELLPQVAQVGPMCLVGSFVVGVVLSSLPYLHRQLGASHATCLLARTWLWSSAIAQVAVGKIRCRYPSCIMLIRFCLHGPARACRRWR